MTDPTPVARRPHDTRRPRRRLLGLLVAVVAGGAAVAALPAPAPAATRWGTYHWARTTPTFTVALGDDVVSAWDPYLAKAATDWTASSVLDTPVVAGQTNPKTCRPTAGRVEVCNAKYGATGWLGIASVWANGDHITQATAKLNDTYFGSASYNTPAWKQFVTCQEIGHTFGLGHDNETFDDPNKGTCMDYTNDPSGTAGTNGTLANTSPNAADYSLLEQIYAHADATTTVAASSTATGRAAAGDQRADWGRAVGRDAKGRDDHFVKDLGNGELLISFVIWAD